MTTNSKTMPDERELERLGMSLHDKIIEAMTEAGLQFVEHDDDREHNIAVGRAEWMFREGDPDAAESWYNGWANQHGYPGVAIKSRDPLLVDIGTIIPGGMMAHFDNGSVRILSVGNLVRPASGEGA